MPGCQLNVLFESETFIHHQVVALHWHCTEKEMERNLRREKSHPSWRDGDGVNKENQLCHNIDDTLQCPEHLHFVILFVCVYRQPSNLKQVKIICLPAPSSHSRRGKIVFPSFENLACRKRQFAQPYFTLLPDNRNIYINIYIDEWRSKIGNHRKSRLNIIISPLNPTLHYTLHNLKLSE